MSIRLAARKLAAADNWENDGLHVLQAVVSRFGTLRVLKKALYLTEPSSLESPAIKEGVERWYRQRPGLKHMA